MESSFRFRQFEVRNGKSALKVGTDAVLLGAAMTLLSGDRELLDIGTGTGVIALMAAQRCGGRITGIDIDALSSEEAEENFKTSPWADRLRAENVPLSDFHPDRVYDVIFSNPPYYDNSLKNPGERESIARHTGALSIGDICSFASDRLAEDGRLSIIYPSESERMLVRTAASFGLFPFRIIRIRTTETKPFRRVIAEFGRCRGMCAEESLTLQRGGRRTEEYRKLTEDFYL